jgi:hypothetical protein
VCNSKHAAGQLTVTTDTSAERHCSIDTSRFFDLTPQQQRRQRDIMVACVQRPHHARALTESTRGTECHIGPRTVRAVDAEALVGPTQPTSLQQPACRCMRRVVRRDGRAQAISKTRETGTEAVRHDGSDAATHTPRSPMTPSAWMASASRSKTVEHSAAASTAGLFTSCASGFMRCNAQTSAKTYIRAVDTVF